MTQYKNAKGEVYNGRYVEVEGRRYISPSRARLLSLGYKEVVVEQPPTDDSEQEIWGLKRLLAESDYKAIKYAEGWLSDEDYAAVKAQRQAWRARINALEGGGA